MRWITRRNAHVDRTACPWLIARFIDPAPEFVFVPADADPAALDGRTFDMVGGDYTHSGGRCTFQVMLTRHGLERDPALVEMGRIIGDADVPPSRRRRLEAEGLHALITGFQLTVPDDHAKLRLTQPLYEALYAYCQAKVRAQPPRGGVPRPSLRHNRRVALHLTSETTEADAPPPPTGRPIGPAATPAQDDDQPPAGSVTDPDGEARSSPTP